MPKNSSYSTAARFSSVVSGFISILYRFSGA